jgi:hypothetical protein
LLSAMVGAIDNDVTRGARTQGDSMRNWLAVVALLVAPAALMAQKVIIDSDPAGQFASYKTYGWTRGTPADNPLSERRIHAAVEQQLAAKGFTASATPDVYVATLVATKEQKELIADGYGGGFFWGGGTVTTRAHTYVVGTLVVDLYDARSKQLVWRANGSDTLSGKPEKNAQKVDKALAKMFEKYPPAR